MLNDVLKKLEWESYLFDPLDHVGKRFKPSYPRSSVGHKTSDGNLFRQDGHVQLVACVDKRRLVIPEVLGCSACKTIRIDYDQFTNLEQLVMCLTMKQ